MRRILFHSLQCYVTVWGLSMLLLGIIDPANAFAGVKLARVNTLQSLAETQKVRQELNGFRDNSRLPFPPSSSSPSMLQMSNGGFDLSKPTFDLFSLRSIRADALLQYNTLNQSEPLRINLYALLTVALWSYPSLSEALVGEIMTLPATVGAIAGGFGSLALFVRECGRRSNQLTRIEKELNAAYLPVRLPQTNPFADRAMAGDIKTLGALKGSKRVLALCGNAQQLKEALVDFQVLRKRLVQASVVVVVVANDESKPSDWGILNQGKGKLPPSWLAEPHNMNAWISYFRDLYEDSSSKTKKDQLLWFGLNNNGRSFASGVGEPPRLMEMLGQNLRPTELLDEDDPADTSGEGSVEAVLQAQKDFYDALTKGNLDSMTNIYSDKQAVEVSEVLDAGGRVDKWKVCLEDGARPSGMLISGSDALIVSETEAYSTCVEFPPNAGIEGATLLATQKWQKDGESPWKLKLHQTIPWSPDSRAGGTLRCDCRGCVALTRGPERRTFGGIIG